jgi:hypothetical protein
MLTYNKDGEPSFSSKTPGASIGFRIRGNKEWELFTHPSALEAEVVYETIAHRIGHKKSAVVELSLSRTR